MSTETTQTIYVVTSGEYSGYSINALFSTRELAEAYCAAVSESRKGSIYATPEIEEWALDEFSDRWREGLAPYCIEMLRDGTLHWLSPASAIESRSRICQCPDRGKGWPAKVTALYSIVWAKDREHAVKIANERRTQMIALGEWPEEQR